MRHPPPPPPSSSSLPALLPINILHNIFPQTPDYIDNDPSLIWCLLVKTGFGYVYSTDVMFCIDIILLILY